MKFISFCNKFVLSFFTNIFQYCKQNIYTDLHTEIAPAPYISSGFFFSGKFLWPGFGENIRVIDWMLRRVDGEDNWEPSAVGLLPKKSAMNLQDLSRVDWDELFSLPKDYWEEDIKETKEFLENQVGCDLPEVIRDELDQLEKRISWL